MSIVFFTETWRPDSFYDRILANRRQGLHTLCLLDIKVKEPTLESLARGKKVYEPPRFMSIQTAVRQLLEVEASRKVTPFKPASFRCQAISNRKQPLLVNISTARCLSACKGSCILVLK